MMNLETINEIDSPALMSELDYTSNPNSSQPSDVHADENSRPLNSNPNSPMIPPRKSMGEGAETPECLHIEVSKPTQKGGESPMSAKDSSSSPEKDVYSPYKLSVRERFAYAKKMQEKREKDRLNKLKHSPRRSILGVQAAGFQGLTDSRTTKDSYESPNQKAFHERFRDRNMTPNQLWSEAIKALQAKQGERYEQMRSNTNNFSKEVDGFQLASKRINEWEDHNVYDPTAVELAEIWMKIRGYLQLPIEKQLLYVQNADEVQAMILGSVKVLSCDNLDDEARQFLHKMLRPPTKYIGLRTAVQTLMPNQKWGKVNLKVIAMACRVRGREPCLFAVAYPLNGFEDDPNLFGCHRMKLLIQNTRFQLLQQGIQIVTPDLAADFGDLAIEDFPINEAYGDGDDDDNFAEEDINAAADAMELFRQTNATLGASASLDDDDLRLVDFDAPGSFSSSNDGTQLDQALLSSNSNAFDEISESTAATYSMPSQAFISMDLNSVVAVSCSEKLFVATMDAHRQVSLVSNALKKTTAESMCVSVSNRVFELSRGVATSGYVSKFPTTSQGWGKVERRYFVLKENILSYFTTRPSGDVFAPDLRPRKTFLITHNTTIETCTVLFRRCIKVHFPESDQCLWLKTKKAGCAKEVKWLSALKLAIASQQRKKAHPLSLTLKTLWFHEGSNFELIAVDACVYPQMPLRVALFKCHIPADQAHASTVHKPRSLSVDDNEDDDDDDDEADQPTNGRVEVVYVVDVITNSQEKLQLELVRTNEKPFNHINLTCIKIYGDKLILGGSQGAIAIASIGRTTGMSVESGRKVLYCVPCRMPPGMLLSPSSSSPSVSLSDRQVLVPAKGGKGGSTNASTVAKPATLMKSVSSSTISSMNPEERTAHGLDATVNFLAWEAQNDVFVAVDDQRLLTFWQLERPDESTVLNKISGSKAKMTSVTTPVPPLLESPSKKRPGFYYTIKPEFQSAFHLARTDPEGLYASEEVRSAYFLPDTGHLVVTTTLRMLLLLVTYAHRRPLQVSSGGKEDNRDADLPPVTCCYGVAAYSELDRVSPTSGQTALFGIQVIDPPAHLVAKQQQLLQQQQQQMQQEATLTPTRPLSGRSPVPPALIQRSTSGSSTIGTTSATAAGGTKTPERIASGRLAAPLSLSRQNSASASHPILVHKSSHQHLLPTGGSTQLPLANDPQQQLLRRRIIHWRFVADNSVASTTAAASAATARLHWKSSSHDAQDPDHIHHNIDNSVNLQHQVEHLCHVARTEMSLEHFNEAVMQAISV